MRVWIDQDLCTGDGICTEIAPDVFFMYTDGLAYVREVGTSGLDWNEPIHTMTDSVPFPGSMLDAVIESAEECPGECIFIEESWTN